MMLASGTLCSFIFYVFFNSTSTGFFNSTSTNSKLFGMAWSAQMHRDKLALAYKEIQRLRDEIDRLIADTQPNEDVLSELEDEVADQEVCSS
jgi:hypothetical protein